MKPTEDELDSTTFKIYIYLIKNRAPVPPRAIMHALGITSLGVVNRHLQKLTNWGWVEKNVYGYYFAKKKVGFRGYVWIGKTLLSTGVLFALSFVVLTGISIFFLIFHLVKGLHFDYSLVLLIVVTVIAAPFLLAEALKPRKKTPKSERLA